MCRPFETRFQDVGQVLTRDICPFQAVHAAELQERVWHGGAEDLEDEQELGAACIDMGGGTTTSFGQYFVIVLTLIFLATGAHLHWIALVTESYNAFPPGQTWLGADRFAAIAGFASFMFETALRIALPVTVILLLVQVLTGVLSRSAPSLNLFALGLPAGVLAGMAALIISAPLIYDQFTGLVGDALAQTENVILP